MYSADSKDIKGSTRFIHHSCDPNRAIYTVSYNLADVNLYDVAFFTTKASRSARGSRNANESNIMYLILTPSDSLFKEL